jgi:pSer/pThr/pTyr-binding forkhead associated (FHA) protein
MQASVMSTGASLTLPTGEEVRLHPDLTIGRGEANDITISSKTVSRQHAQIAFTDGRWVVHDRGSANGTFVNGARVTVGAGHPLRHGDRIRLGAETLVFSSRAERADPDRTETLEETAVEMSVQLSPFQLQIVRLLCRTWLASDDPDELPSNEQIAIQLGTPRAAGAVKAALRRVYAKAGLSDLPAHTKRRVLCRTARQRGWL